MNVSQSNSTKCVRDTSVTSVVFPCLYSILFLAALVLNLLAAWIFFQIPSTSTFVVYLKNVVAADLLMTFTVLVKVLSDSGVGSWRLKVVYCRYSAVLFYTTMYISILLLGLISLDRYLKIVRPFGKCFLQRVGFGQGLSVAVWVIITSLALPNVVLSNREPIHSPKLRCSSLKDEAGLLWHEGFNYFCQVIFWGTLALMVVCYTFISRKVYKSYQTSRSRSSATTKRTKAKVFIVVVVFFICFAPFHFNRVPYTLTQTRNANTCRVQNLLYIVKETTLWLSAANICLDPLIYIFLCRMFRRKLTAALSPSCHTICDTSSSMVAEVLGNRTSEKSSVLTVVFPVLYSLLFIVGLVMNCLAAWIFSKIRSRSSFILYLKNITAADFLMTLTFPLQAAIEAEQGIWQLQLRILVCRYSAVLFYASMYVSIMFLGLVSLDRYLKIVRPFGHSCLYSYTFTRVLSAGVWLTMIGHSLPNIILTNNLQNASIADRCIDLKCQLGKDWHAIISYVNIFIFTAVLITLLVCYVCIYRHVQRSNAQFVNSTESRGSRPGQNISMVMVVFFVCFVPYHLWRIPFTLSQIDKEFSKEIKVLLRNGKKITLFLTACNVFLDPIIYFLMCKSFTRRLRAQLGLKRNSNSRESQSKVQTLQVRQIREYSSAKG
ncbi:hypothetical protein GJAV_G00055610 [Gymnothorax javanicus]|nr:hypothetical protein GJAV_G00055610 [Gymnothorax javanicus]